MFSMSMSVPTLRFYLGLSSKPGVATIALRPPNHWFIIYDNGGYEACTINGFISHAMLMPSYTVDSILAFLRGKTYHRNHDRKGIDQHLLLRDITITKDYIEFDQHRDFRFPIDIDMVMLPQASAKQDRIAKMLDPLFFPDTPFLKTNRELWMEVHDIARDTTRFTFALPYTATSAFVLHHRSLYMAYTSRSGKRVPVKLEKPFTALASSKPIVFPIHNRHLSAVYEGFKKKLVDDVVLIPLWDSYIIEGRLDGVLRWKWHAKGVETAHFLAPVIRSVETSEDV